MKVRVIDVNFMGTGFVSVIFEGEGKP